MQYQFNANRHNKIPKQWHRVTNWAGYNEDLRSFSKRFSGEYKLGHRGALPAAFGHGNSQFRRFCR